MITLQEVENRLAEAGLRNRYWGRPEVRELQHIIVPEEVITHAMNGRYEGGFCLLVATDRRLILIDKKPLVLNLHEIRYDTLVEVDYTGRLFDSTLLIRSLSKNIHFTTMRQARLRRLTSRLQETISELRQQNANPAAQMITYAHDPTTGEYSPVIEYVSMESLRPTGTAMPQVTFRRRVSRFYPTN